MSSLKFRQSNGFSSLLKEGYKHYGGLEVRPPDRRRARRGQPPQ
jgi:hypothetical protein